MGHRPRCEIIIQGMEESTANFKERLDVFLNDVYKVDYSSVESVTSSITPDSRLCTTVLYFSTVKVDLPDSLEPTKILQQTKLQTKNKKS